MNLIYGTCHLGMRQEDVMYSMLPVLYTARLWLEKHKWCCSEMTNCQQPTTRRNDDVIRNKPVQESFMRGIVVEKILRSLASSPTDVNKCRTQSTTAVGGVKQAPRPIRSARKATNTFAIGSFLLRRGMHQTKFILHCISEPNLLNGSQT
jgi:hypothetical protein